MYFNKLHWKNFVRTCKLARTSRCHGIFKWNLMYHAKVQWFIYQHKCFTTRSWMLSCLSWDVNFHSLWGSSFSRTVKHPTTEILSKMCFCCWQKNWQRTKTTITGMDELFHLSNFFILLIALQKEMKSLKSDVLVTGQECLMFLWQPSDFKI